MAITKVTNSLVSVNAIHGTLIADNAITSVHIAQNQVTSVQIPDGSITAVQLGVNSVTPSELSAGSVETSHISDANVTTAKIANANVTTAKIANNAITSALIPDGSITDTQLGSGAFTMGTITTTGAIRGPASLTIDPATVGDNTGTVVIAGNLQVDGTTTTVNSTTLDVADKNITIGKGQNESGSGGSGITVDGSNATILWDETNTSWDFNNPITIERAATADMLIAETTSNNTRSFLTTKSKDSGGNNVQLKLGTLGDGPYGMLFTLTNHPLNFATNNAAPQMTLLTNGNFGIGTTNPGSKLSIASGTDSTNQGDGISFYGTAVNNQAAIKSFNTGAYDGDLRFYTSDHSTASTTIGAERMRIDSNGKVGIGTINPSTKLTVKNDSASTSFGGNNIITIQNANTTDNSRMGLAFTGNTGIGSGLALVEAQSYDQSHGKTSLNFSVYSGSWHNDMMVLKEGKVGIGTTTPASTLNVKGDIRITRPVDAGHASEGNWNFSISHEDAARYGSLYITPSVATAEISLMSNKFRFTKAGRLGIGVTAPGEKLEVNGVIQIKRAGDHPAMRFVEDTTTRGYIGSGDWAVNGLAQADFGISSVGVLAFATTGGVERMRILANGNVGIGVVDPDTNLEVNIKGAADGNGIHITSTSATNDPALKLSRNGGAADSFLLRPRGTSGSAYLSIAPGSTPDGGINLSSTGRVGLGGNNAPTSTLHITGTNTADVASNGAAINGLQLSRTSSKGENLYAYMTDGNAAGSSWTGIGNVGKIESYGNNAFEIGSQQNIPVVIGQNNTQKIKIKGDITTHAKFGSTYIESLYTPNGGVQNCRIFEDHLGKWIAIGYFAADAKLSIQTTWGSVRGAPTGLGQSETTVFSADWGDSYPTEVRYLGATDFSNFQETKTIDFIHGVPRGRPWKQFFNNAHRIPDGGTSVSSSLMGTVQGPVGSVKNGWECRGAYDGRGRWHNPSYTHHRMSDATSINCADTAFTTPTSSHFNWEAASDAKISVHNSLDYSGQDGITSAAFGNDDNIVAFFDDYPTNRSNFGGTANNYTSAVYVLMKLPEMQSIGLEGGRARDHQPGEVVQTKLYERGADVSATSGLTGELGHIDFTPLYGNSLLEFNVHANTGTNSAGSVFWQIYQGSPSAVGTLIRRTGNQIVAAYDQAADGHPLPFSWTQYYQLNDDKKSSYRYRVRFTPSGATYWGHTYGSTARSYFTIKEIKQEHDAKGIMD